MKPAYRNALIKLASAVSLLTWACFGSVPRSVAANDSVIIPPYETYLAADRTSPLQSLQRFISRADGDRCPMYPTCSRYASQAFAHHGVLMGWVLTCDRLLRCGRDETRLTQPIRVQGVRYAYDPLDANTFWWNEP